MHIGEKVLSLIEETLMNKYSVFINEDWKIYTQPLIFDETGKIDLAKFKYRQDKSTEIIKDILDRHGKKHIVNFLGILATIESSIQELEPWVRDHVVHAVNTFIIGVYLLDNLKLPKTRSKFKYPFMWKLCGPTHDLGYPIEISRNLGDKFVNKFNDILDGIDSISPHIQQELYPESLVKLCDNRNGLDLIEERLHDWNIDINVKEYLKWLKLKNKTDHGIISALAQLKVIDAYYTKANPKREKKYKEVGDFDYNQNNFDIDIVNSSSALFLHNISPDYPGIKDKIEFKIAPLAFILFLCDTFQEWDRYAERRPIHSGCDFDIGCTENSISLSVPIELEKDMIKDLNFRLTGLSVIVNGKVAVEV